MRMRVNFRPGLYQLLHSLARGHTLVRINIPCVVILNEVKDLTIDDRSRNEIYVFKPSIEGSLALLGMTDQWI